MLHHALGIIGITLTDAQETMALGGVNRNFNSYVQLRNIDIPLDPPAFRFCPAALSIRQARFLPRKRELKSFTSVEDLAFRPAAELGALVRARHVTSTEGTEPYQDQGRMSVGTETLGSIVSPGIRCGVDSPGCIRPPRALLAQAALRHHPE